MIAPRPILRRALHLPRYLLMLPVWLYRRVISPLKPPTCRFRPTCSEYAIEALRRHGVLYGTFLAARRILRCQPFCEPGEDPVPPRRQPRSQSRRDCG